MKNLKSFKKKYYFDFQMLALLGVMFLFIFNFVELKQIGKTQSRRINSTKDITQRGLLAKVNSTKEQNSNFNLNMTNNFNFQTQNVIPIEKQLLQTEIKLDEDENDVGIYYKRKLEFFLVNQNYFKYSDSDQILNSKKQYIEEIEQNNSLRESLGHAIVDRMNIESEAKHKFELIQILGSNFYEQFSIWSQEQEKIIADSLAGDQEPLSKIN